MKLFCKHIWKQIDIEDLDLEIVYAFEFPVGEIRYEAITYKCAKCNKQKIVYEEHSRRLTLEETKKLLGW